MTEGAEASTARRPTQPSRRFVLAAFGDPGHVFPMLALGRELRARGHSVVLQTWIKWREHTLAEGLEFWPAPEYPTVPSRERPFGPYEAAGHAAAALVDDLAAYSPDAVVADILTLAPALAAEARDVPWATLVPHLYHVRDRGQPPFSSGFAPASTAFSRSIWGALDRPVRLGLERGRRDLDRARAMVGLGKTDRLHGGASPDLVMVATLPELEPPHAWPRAVELVGPLMWEPPFAEVAPPPGDDPLVVVAPSTAHDQAHRMLRAALEGLGELPVRVLATTNRRPPPFRPRPAANTRLVEWISYAQTMPRAAIVVSHGGHGTVMRALTSGAALVTCPVAGDMFENAARVEWAGLGVRLSPRLLRASTLALAVEKVLAEPALSARAQALATRHTDHEGPARAADLLESFCARRDRRALITSIS